MIMSEKTFDRRGVLKLAGASTVGVIAGCMSNNQTGDGSGTSMDNADESAGTTTTNPAEPDTINIGSIQPLSGNFAPWGQAHSSGLKFAVEEINSNGGVLDGQKMNVVEANSKSDPAEASSIFDRFTEQNGIVAAAGPVSSDVGIRTSRTAEEQGVPILMHTAGSDKTITKETRHTFRMGMLPAATTMEAQAQLAQSLGYNNIGAIVADYAWGQSVKSGIENKFDLNVAIQVAPVGADDFSSYIRKMPRDIQMVIATGHPPGSLTITQQMYELGYEPEVITGPAFPPGVIRSALGDDANRGFTHIHLTDVYGEEFAEVGKRYGESVGQQFNTHTSYGYVAGKLIAQAIENAGEANSQAVTEAIRTIEFDTLYRKPIQYSEYGELKDQVQLYSTLSLDAPSYYAEGEYSYDQVFKTDPLPALPAES